MKYSHNITIIAFLLSVLQDSIPSCNAFIIQSPPQQSTISFYNNNKYKEGCKNTNHLVLYASTLEETTDITKTKIVSPNNDNKNDKNNDSNKNNDSTTDIVVSANHIFTWDESSNEMIIKESTRKEEDSYYYSELNNKVVQIVYEKDQEQYDQHDQYDQHEQHEQYDLVELSSSSSSIHSSLSSSSSPPSNYSSQPYNGIKMTNSNDLHSLSKSFQNNEDDKAMNTKATTTNTSTSSTTSFTEKITNSGVASAAAMATAAVNAAVSMKTLEAPSTTKSYISIDTSQTIIDEDGLPLQYDKDAIETYWKKERGALNKRWGYFVSKAVPFLTRLTTLFIKDGKIEDKYIPELSEQARIDLQDLGPTFIKAGQMMSVRPDVLPQATLDELTKLQDSVVPFSTTIAVEQIERELGGPLGQFFTSISEEPVAAASLAQVYLATLNDGKDTKVAIKVQRPSVLSTVSKDLYVLRRAAEVFQGLVERFAPQQKTNYVALLNEWSIGFYTELDFQNEARNQQRLRDELKQRGIKGITVPRVFEDLCTRRILVSEWMDGVKLSDCSNEEIGELIPIAQEAFLTQLFELGFFHAE